MYFQPTCYEKKQQPINELCESLALWVVRKKYQFTKATDG